MGQRGKKIFLHFCVFQSILSRLRHTFFQQFFKRERSAGTENASAKHEAREREATKNASAKPEGAKRPSSPAGLAGRSAERACKLVFS